MGKVYRKFNIFATAILAVVGVCFTTIAAFNNSAYADAPITVCNSGCDYSNLQDAINNNAAGSIIQLKSDLVTTSSITIDESVTVDGQGYVINPNFNKTSNSNNATLNIIANNVNIKNLIIDGSNGTDLHGINVYTVTSVNIDNVTIKNNDRDGLVVNGSSVAVNNIFTSNNGRGGIDVDQGSGVDTPALLTVNGKSVHSETAEDIIVDNTAPSVPIMNFSANGKSIVTNGYTTLKNFKFDLTSSSDATRYQLKYWNDITGSRFKESTPWSPTNLSSYSSSLGVYNDQFTQGEGTHYFSFSACDAANNCSEYSSPFVITYDKTAPVVTITSQKDDDVVSGNVIIQGTVVDNNPDHYYLVIKDSDGKVVAGPGVVYKDNVQDWTWDTTKIADGTYTIDLEARDKAGNKSSSSVTTVSVVVDNVKPTINYESYTQLNNAITPEIAASDYSSFSWTADPLNPAGATFDDTKITPTFSVINNGTYKFTLKVTDDQGSSVSYVFEFTYTKPVEAVTSGLTSGTTTSFTNVTATPVSSTASTDADTTGEVLGAQTKTDDSNKNSQASKVASVEDSNIWSILGLAWYWWLLIIAAILLLWRIIVAIVKNKKQEENTN